MRLHRFYITPQTTELKHDFWLHDKALINQWVKVFRFQPPQQVVLFNGKGTERLYKIMDITAIEAHLVLVTEFSPQIPTRNIYLFWSLLKKDKNDWVIQKCTELGVRHFIPLLSERSEKTGFNEERALKIAIEAAEQCGRSDIPSIREPILLQTVFGEYLDDMTLLVCEKVNMSDSEYLAPSNKNTSVGLLVGPEGGWSEKEKALFKDHGLPYLNLHDFTLRAETACVTAVTRALD